MIQGKSSENLVRGLSRFGQVLWLGGALLIVAGMLARKLTALGVSGGEDVSAVPPNGGSDEKDVSV